MPPRFAYWTILIDQKPTAFRAAEKEDLLPTLVQLQRKNADVVLKWFARGKLWDTPEQATWARTNLDRPGDKRNRDWRPGGKHEDPRMRFKKGGRRDSPRAAFAKKASFEAKSTDKPWDKRPLPSAPRPKWSRPSAFSKPSPDRPAGDRPPSGDRPKWSGDRRPPSGDRPKWGGDRRPAPAAKRSDGDAPRPLPTKPLPSSARPKSKWSGDRKPSPDGARGDRRPPPRGVRPSYGKPSTYAKAPADKPEGRPFKKPDRNRR